jgi:Na+-driven multidrug efflux pump
VRNWRALVEQRLAGLALVPEERAEVIAEVTEHLEDICEEMLRQGVTEEAAAERALSQVENWQSLRREIQTARRRGNAMTNRVRQLWLPGLLTLLLSMVLLMVIQFIGPKPLIVSAHGWQMVAPVAVIYVPWLLALLPIGAMGAYLAGRAGASQRAMFLSMVFPVLPYFVFFVVALPVALILDDHVAHNIMFSALFVGLVAWVVLPGTALLAGGLPVAFWKSRRPTASDVARA